MLREICNILLRAITIDFVRRLLRTLPATESPLCNRVNERHGCHSSGLIRGLVPRGSAWKIARHIWVTWIYRSMVACRPMRTGTSCTFVCNFCHGIYGNTSNGYQGIFTDRSFFFFYSAVCNVFSATVAFVILVITWTVSLIEGISVARDSVSLMWLEL